MGLIINELKKIKKRKEIRNRRKYWTKEFLLRSKEVVLTREQKQEINDFYSKYNLKVNSLFHNFYLEKTGKFYSEYIPDDIYYSYIDPFYNDWKAAKILDNKCLYTRIFPNVKQPQTILTRMNGIWLGQNMEVVLEENIYKEINKYKNVVLKKATDSEGGKGVYFVEGKRGTNEIKKIINSIKGDIVIQQVLKQHKVLSSLNSSSVNTIRVLSLLTKDEVKICSVVVRMGINGSKVDNASSGGITCGINSKGRLNKFAYAANGDKYDKHPTSKIKFQDVIIPNYENVIKLIDSLHPTIPMFRLVSWDIAIDEDSNPVLIEANLKYGELDFHQLNNGPVFGKDTKRILNEVFKKRS